MPKEMEAKEAEAPSTKPGGSPKGRKPRIVSSTALLTPLYYSAVPQTGSTPNDSKRHSSFAASAMFSYPNCAVQLVNGGRVLVQVDPDGLVTQLTGAVYNARTDRSIMRDLMTILKRDAGYRIPPVVTELEIHRYMLEQWGIRAKFVALDSGYRAGAIRSETMFDLAEGSRDLWKHTWYKSSYPYSSDISDSQDKMDQLKDLIDVFAFPPALQNDIEWLYTLKVLDAGGGYTPTAQLVPYNGPTMIVAGDNRDRINRVNRQPDLNQMISPLSLEEDIQAFRGNTVNREINALLRRVTDSAWIQPLKRAYNEKPDSEWMALWSNGGVVLDDTSDPGRDTITPNAGSEDADERFRVPLWADGGLTERFNAHWCHGYGETRDTFTAYHLLNAVGVPHTSQLSGSHRLPLFIYESEDYRKDPEWREVPAMSHSEEEILRAASYDAFSFGYRNLYQSGYSLTKGNEEMGVRPLGDMRGRPRLADTAQVRDEAWAYYRKAFEVTK